MANRVISIYCILQYIARYCVVFSRLKNKIIHYPTRDLQGRLSPIEQGVTVFTIIYTNDLNAEKIPAQR